MTTQTKRKTDVYERVTDQIIRYLETGTSPWRRSWGVYGLAKNYYTQKPYRSINALLLNMAPVAIPYFLTFKQANMLGGKVKKGSQARMVTYFSTVYTDRSGDKLSREQALSKPVGSYKTFSFLKHYWVFSTKQIEGIEFNYPDIQLNDNEKIKRCEQLLHGMSDKPDFVSIDKTKCYYRASDDTLNMPEIKYFDSSEAYYNVLFHELCHSTGHEKRLSRKGITETSSFGSKPYSEEELLAEIGASYLCGLVGIDREAILENNAAYINGWLSVLKKDKMFIFRVAREAQNAADYIST